MQYCAKCLYPANAKPTIIFDEDGICSGCNYNQSRSHMDVDWEERNSLLADTLNEAKLIARERGNVHDCIIPVSGGKDSHFQVWLLKERFGMNPLLVSFNHGFNTRAGLRNLRNLIEKSGCECLVLTAGKSSVKKISRYMLKTVGDLTWHYHAGIRTFPFRVAVDRNIPLIVWGEHGFAELTGLVSLKDFVEFTKWTRKEHDMRGFEAEDLIGCDEISELDVAPYVYPTDEQILETEVRGIYLSNFVKWHAEKQARFMKQEWDFGFVSYKRERTFNLYSKLEDHANDVHDYLKYLKFGYGRATDDASMAIRHGVISREEGLKLASIYDANTPSTLMTYCQFLEITTNEFYDYIEPMRDPAIWEKRNGKWSVTDSVWRGFDVSRIELNSELFSDCNRSLYYNEKQNPPPSGEKALDEFSLDFTWM
jgi:N-acetyl sugar amidotransferase